MSTINDGGPAFPAPNITDGMTLRDYFAAHAMQGLIVDVDYPKVDSIAKMSYKMADAMLAARNARQQP